MVISCTAGLRGSSGPRGGYTISLYAGQTVGSDGNIFDACITRSENIFTVRVSEIASLEIMDFQQGQDISTQVLPEQVWKFEDPLGIKLDVCFGTIRHNFSTCFKGALLLK